MRMRLPTGHRAYKVTAAQAAALIMSANDDLSHFPSPDWKCWSQLGADGASSSNLALGARAANAVALYMADPGASNAPAGHRMWLLSPTATAFGTGSTDNANALTVIGTPNTPDLNETTVVAWPSEGYFPSELEPGGRWSVALPGADFSDATISVAGPNGPLTITSTTPGFLGNSIVFEVAGVDALQFGAEVSYDVRVAGVQTPEGTRTIEYSTTLFRAAPPPPPPPPPPAPSIRPVGALDAVEVRGRRVTLYGWAADANQPDGALPVLAAGSGRFAWGIASGPRPDLAAIGVTTSAGYAVTLELPPGRHQVCMAGIDTYGGAATGGYTRFGCQTVVVK